MEILIIDFYEIEIVIFDNYLPIQDIKTLTSKGFQGRGTNGVQE